MKRSIVLAAFFAAACSRTPAAEAPHIEPPANEVWVTPQQIRDSGIATTAVENEPVGNAFSATGRVTFSDTHVAHVFSPVTGRVTSLFASLGEPVHRGDALAFIDSPDVGSAVSDVEKS